MKKDPVVNQAGDQLQKAIKAIENISLALAMARPIGSMDAADRLVKALPKAIKSIDRYAQPFSLLADEVIAACGQFARAELEQDEDHSADGLWQQLKMIEWYRDHRQTAQAATLAQEWVVSVLVVRFGDRAGRLLSEHGRSPLVLQG